jgi:hypothetical protein
MPTSRGAGDHAHRLSAYVSGTPTATISTRFSVAVPVSIKTVKSFCPSRKRLTASGWSTPSKQNGTSSCGSADMLGKLKAPSQPST